MKRPRLSTKRMDFSKRRFETLTGLAVSFLPLVIGCGPDVHDLTTFDSTSALEFLEDLDTRCRQSMAQNKVDIALKTNEARNWQTSIIEIGGEVGFRERAGNNYIEVLPSGDIVLAASGRWPPFSTEFYSLVPSSRHNSLTASLISSWEFAGVLDMLFVESAGLLLVSRLIELDPFDEHSNFRWIEVVALSLAEGGRVDFLEERVLFRSAPIPDVVNPGGWGQSGGRLELLDGRLLLTIGDFRLVASDAGEMVSTGYLTELPNDPPLGAIIAYGKLSNGRILVSGPELIARGVRNSQGLVAISDSRAIFADHGPSGGAELNIIDLTEVPTDFGWPHTSFGSLYGGWAEAVGTPLVVERLLTNPSSITTSPQAQNWCGQSTATDASRPPVALLDETIAPSQLVMISKETEFGGPRLLLGTLRGESLIFISMNEDYRVQDYSVVGIGSRIRDLVMREGVIFISTDADEILTMAL